MVEAGLFTQLGWKIEFDGHHMFEEISAATDPPIGKLKNPRLVSGVTQAVANVIVGHAKKGQLPVTLGGDHSLVCALVMCSPTIPTAR
jgi:arginase